MSDFLSPAEQAQLETLRRRDSFAREVLLQVSRITSSRHFARVQQRAKDFLAFVVAKTLLGQAEQIKETVVAMAVFEQSADFDPAGSSMVRVAAGELRHRLADYAKRQGRAETIEITLPLNTYVPKFHDRRVTIAITTFENWHPQGEQGHLCEIIAAELAYQFEKAGLRAIRTGSRLITPAHYQLRGSVESQEEELRIHLSLADAKDGQILCSRVAEGRRDDVLALTREVADTLFQSLRPVKDALPDPSIPVRKRA